MADESGDVEKLILGELREIKSEVRLIPRLQAQVDLACGATHQLDMAMRETTAALQMQATAHGKLLDEVRMQQHQLTAALMGVSNDVQALIPRVRDLEKQVVAAFQQQVQLAKDVREAAIFPNPEEYQGLKVSIAALPKLCADIKEVSDQVREHIPWLNGIELFLRLLFYALASSAVAGLLWLLGKALTNGL